MSTGVTLIAGTPPTPSQWIIEVSGVTHLAHEVIAFGPGPDHAGAAAVAHAVQGQLGHDESDLADPLRVYTRAAGVLGGQPSGLP